MSLVDRILEGSEIAESEQKWPTFDGKELDRNAYVTASEIWSCRRMLWFAKNGAEQDEGYTPNRGYFDRGHNVEAWVIDMISRTLNENEELRFAGRDQRSFYSDELKMSGTPDGLVTVHTEGAVDGCTLIEVKSVDPRTNFTNLPKKNHLKQVQVNMGLVRMLSNELAPDKARIIYVDSSDYHRMIEFIVSFEPEEFERLKRRAAAIFAAQSASEFSADGAVTGTCKYCPYHKVCGDAFDDDAAPPDPAPIDFTQPDGDLQVMAAQFVDARDREAECKKLKDELREAIVFHMHELGEEETVAGPFKVKAQETAGRRSLNRKKLEKELGDLSSYETVGKPSVRLTVALENGD